jgi:hypothetical protein
VGYGQDLIVNQSSREGQRLPNIFVLKFWVFALQFGTVGIDGECFKYSAHGKTEVPDARLAVHPSRISRDSIEFLHLFFASPRQVPGVFEKFSA